MSDQGSGSALRVSRAVTTVYVIDEKTGEEVPFEFDSARMIAAALASISIRDVPEPRDEHDDEARAIDDKTPDIDEKIDRRVKAVRRTFGLTTPRPPISSRGGPQRVERTVKGGVMFRELPTAEEIRRHAPWVTDLRDVIDQLQQHKVTRARMAEFVTGSLSWRWEPLTMHSVQQCGAVVKKTGEDTWRLLGLSVKDKCRVATKVLSDALQKIRMRDEISARAKKR